MRWTQYFIPTVKETPQEALIKSHRLMIRAGLIRKLASGTYSYLPLGLRALQKATDIVREEMNRAGALELLMPALHPAELWKETGRYDIMGEGMLHIKDRHGKENVLAPTHEEVITDIARRELRSYKQLPMTLYQIQTKFRDEARPRSGVIRSREFIMKDAYSFHATPGSLDETYNAMKEAYKKIFSRCGLEFYIVEADPGAMGGSGSQEFVLFSDAGEDWMVQYGDSSKVMSVEMARRKRGDILDAFTPRIGKPTDIHTPGLSSVESLSTKLNIKPPVFLKTMIYSMKTKDNPNAVIAVLVRGDHEVSEFKLKEAVNKVYPDSTIAMAPRELIDKIGSAFGFTGPIGLKDIPFFIDDDVYSMHNFIVGANRTDYHKKDVNLADFLNKDRRGYYYGDIGQVVEGDITPDGEPLKFRTAIELGHIFKLNLRYSVPLKAHFLDAQGKENPLIMGCYGIGVNRILAAAIEQHGDDKGIIWPKNISPFQVLAVLIDPKDAQSQQIATQLEGDLAARGIDLLIDDRTETAGVKFNDADLIGIPLRVVLGPKNLKLGKAEIKDRKTGQISLVDLPALSSAVIDGLKTIS